MAASSASRPAACRWAPRGSGAVSMAQLVAQGQAHGRAGPSARRSTGDSPAAAGPIGGREHVAPLDPAGAVIRPAGIELLALRHQNAVQEDIHRRRAVGVIERPPPTPDPRGHHPLAWRNHAGGRDLRDVQGRKRRRQNGRPLTSANSSWIVAAAASVAANSTTHPTAHLARPTSLIRLVPDRKVRASGYGSPGSDAIPGAARRLGIA